jgi:Uncharacterised nucleotidyltransferase
VLLTTRDLAKRRRRPAVIGGRIARALHGAWRHDAGPMELSAAELVPCVDALVRPGAGALVWHRLRDTTWRDAPGFESLRKAHQLDRLRSALATRQVAATVAAMRAAGVDALLLKGWSVAAHYADPGLRPLGDIDLLVRAHDGGAARDTAAGLAVQRPPVDLHTSLLDLTDRTVDALFDRSVLVPLGDVAVRVLGREDQLRHLCLHFFRHAGARPLWLSDIAATLETLPADFDWDRCLAGDALLTERVVAAVFLAEQLLGARPAQPLPVRRHRTPAWLPRAVLESWGRPYDARVHRPTALSLSLRTPGEIIPALWRRWPNPLEATVERRARLTGMWRPLVQLHEATARVFRFIPRLAAGR